MFNIKGLISAIINFDIPMLLLFRSQLSGSIYEQWVPVIEKETKVLIYTKNEIDNCIISDINQVEFAPRTQYWPINWPKIKVAIPYKGDISEQIGIFNILIQCVECNKINYLKGICTIAVCNYNCIDKQFFTVVECQCCRKKALVVCNSHDVDPEYTFHYLGHYWLDYDLSGYILEYRNNNTHVFFDFDDTLIYTKCLRDYRSTSYGRKFIENNPNQLNTSICLNGLEILFNELARNDKVSICTNSPKKLVIAFLKKHGFLHDIPIYAAQNKPNSESFLEILKSKKLNHGGALFVGNSIKDILMAQICKIPIIVAGWGYDNDWNYIRSYEYAPSGIVYNIDQLYKSITDFFAGRNFIIRCIRNTRYAALSEADIKYYNNEYYYPSLSIHNLFPYYSVNNREDFKKSESQKMLTFKMAKNFSENEINRAS